MINKFKRIVVPTDFSDTAETAIQLATELAEYYAANLDVVNVVDATVYAYAGYPFASLSKELMTGAEEALNKVKVSVKNAKLNRYLLSGSPAREIAEKSSMMREIQFIESSLACMRHSRLRRAQTR